jgi:hypothetical protein
MNKSRGILLLEINMVLLLLFVLFTTFYQPFIQILVSLKHMEEDMVLCLSERLLLGRLEQELTFETRELVLQQQATGVTFLKCSLLSADKTRQFFCRPHKEGSGYTFYQSTQVVGRQEGINPLTPPHVKLLNFRACPVDDHSLKLLMTFGLTSSLRQKSTTRFIKLNNGILHEKK